MQWRGLASHVAALEEIMLYIWKQRGVC